MNNPTYDVIVIGAGPAGLLAAQEIASKGHSVGVLEEHPKVGEPDHCAGLLSISGLKSLRLDLPDDVIQNRVIGARIFSPSGYSIRIERGAREAVVVDRRKFDSWLAERALNHGATILTNTKAIRIIPNQKLGYQVCIRENKKYSELTTRIVIDAEGSSCIISKSMGLPGVSKKCKLPAYQYEVINVDAVEDCVEMFYGRSIAPGFFSWIIPLGDRRARVGLAAKSQSKKRLDAAIQRHPLMAQKMKNAEIERRLGGIVLVGLPIKRTIRDQFLVAGDAAGMVKATTGGGVILGGLASQIAGKIVSRALQKDDFSNRILGRYDDTWRALLMKEFRAMYLAQKLLVTLSDKGLDILIKNMSESRLVDVIRREGDMDRQMRVIKKLLMNPRMIMTGLKSLRYFNPFMENI
jgi:geranylgeranyl reductase family protein